MKKERLLEVLRFWEEKAKWWHKMYMQAVWIDNGKGGCYDCYFENQLANSKIELLRQLIAECK